MDDTHLDEIKILRSELEDSIKEIRKSIDQLQEDGHGPLPEQDQDHIPQTSSKRDNALDEVARRTDEIVQVQCSQLEQRIEADDELHNDNHTQTSDVGSNVEADDGKLQNCLFTPRQETMLMHYELYGVFGLMEFMKRTAVWERNREKEHGMGSSRKRKRSHVEDDVGGHISWTRLIDDIDKGFQSRTLFYLCSLPPLLLPALIKGDLPSRMQDADFSRNVGPHIEPKMRQGAYVVYCARTAAQNATQGSVDFVGYGPSFKQMLTILAKMKLYTDVDDPESANMAKEIDSQFGEKKGLDYKKQRRYASGSLCIDMSSHVYWIENYLYLNLHSADSLHKKDPNDPRLSEYMLRCPVYVGLAGYVSERVTKHWNHSTDGSATMGLFCATTKWLYGDEFTIRNFSWHIFKTVSNDDIGLDEIILSVLTSALPTEGGLNVAHCGGSKGNPANKDHNTQTQRLNENAESIERWGFVDQNIADAAEKWSKVSQFFGIERQNQKRRNLEALTLALESAEALKVDVDKEIADAEDRKLFKELKEALERCNMDGTS